jgi:hypothetical protein
METFCMPLHEIRDRFTRSEVFMIGWRSQEQHFHFKKKMKNPSKDGNSYGIGDRRRYGPNDIIPDGLPEKFYAQDVIRDENDIDPVTGLGRVKASPGEVNLSQVTGAEALKYMASIGMPFPVMRNLVPKR